MAVKIVEVKGISKKFGSKIILEDASMNIEWGKFISVIGCNGCGKSTFLKMLCGLSSLDGGEIISSKKLKFNYIPEYFSKLNINAKKYMAHIGEIEGLPKDQVDRKSSELFHEFFLEDMLDIPMKYLSKGTLQKVGVVQAFLMEPDILLLDEPLSGQDRKSQSIFISMVKELKKRGITMVMSCHESFMIESLSDEVYEIENKNFVQGCKEKPIEKDLDVMVFVNGSHEKVQNHEILKLARKIEYKDETMKMKVFKENSNKVIAEALNEGYLLRGMYSENHNEIN